MMIFIDRRQALNQIGLKIFVARARNQIGLKTFVAEPKTDWGPIWPQNIFARA